jgi:hypothetical protein
MSGTGTLCGSLLCAQADGGLIGAKEVAEDPNSPSSSGARRLRGDLGVPLRDLPAVE